MAEHIIAVIGAGGKTTAMAVLASQLRDRSVLVTTTTHIYPGEGSLKDPTGDALRQALSRAGIVCAGSSAREGKLGMLPPEVLRAAMERADAVIYEADGSRSHPLKLHRETEPVLLPQTTHCLVVAGLSALGRPVKEVIHRYDRNPDWDPDAPVSIREMAVCVQETAAVSSFPAPKVFLNQEDTVKDPQVLTELLSLLRQEGLDVRSGSLRAWPEGFFRWVTG